MPRPASLRALPAVLLAAAAATISPATAAPLQVVVHDARVVEGDAGTSELVFEVTAHGTPRRVPLSFTASDLTATASSGDYTDASGVATLQPAKPRLMGHLAPGLLLIPAGVAIAPNGEIVAADGPTGRVHRFSPDGTPIGSFPVRGDGTQRFAFTHPEGVAVNAAGEIFVTNWDRVEKFDGQGNFIRTWGVAGSFPGQLGHAEDIAIDAAGFVYVTEVDNGRVQKFDSNGIHNRMWSTHLFGDPPGDVPFGIAIDAQGNVFVGKWPSGRILKFSPVGALLDVWSDTRGLCAPGKLHVDAAGNLLVSDHHTSRVVVLDSEGRFLTEWTVDQGPLNSGNEFQTNGIVSDGAGNVYVGSRSSSSIVHFRWDAATASVVIPISGDRAFEADETLRLDLAGPAEVVLVDPVAIGTLVNDDPERGPNLVANGGFETSLDGWIGYQGATLGLAEREDGAKAAGVTGGAELAFGINDSPDLVSSTDASARHLYSAWVRSAASGSARLRIREYTGGVLQATTESAETELDGEWRRLSVPVRARTSGATLDFQIIAAFADPGATFQVDDVAVELLGADVPPVVAAPRDAPTGPTHEVVIPVTVHDPEGEPLDALEADLTNLPEATFTVSGDRTSGTLRWRPGFEHVRDAPYDVTFTARNAAATSLPTRIHVGPDLVRNASFEDDLSGWGGHVGASVARVPGGRGEGHAARITLSPAEWSGLNDSPNWASNAGGGRSFVFGAWVRSGSNGGSCRMQVREYRNGTLVGSASIQDSPFGGDAPLTGQWRRFTLGYTCVSADASTLDLTIDAQAASGVDFEVDDVSIVSTDTPSTVEVPVSVPSIELAARVVPNPARGRATLELAIPAPGRLRVDLYDIGGRRVATLADEARTEAGLRRLSLGAGERLVPGVYWYRAAMPRWVRQGRFVVVE